MSTLVTGGRGFVGRHLVDQLLGDGVKVVSVIHRRSRYETPISGELLRSLFEEKLDSRIEPEAA